MFVSINVENNTKNFSNYLICPKLYESKKKFGYVESESIVFNTYYDKRTHTSA